MKSQAKIDKLVFRWEHRASRSLGKKDDSHKQYSLDKYFDFLTEIKPHKQELKYTKVFTTPFTLSVVRRD